MRQAWWSGIRVSGWSTAPKALRKSRTIGRVGYPAPAFTHVVPGMRHEACRLSGQQKASSPVPAWPDPCQNERKTAVTGGHPRASRTAADLRALVISDQLDALDPVTRAAVVAQLSTDEVKKVRSHRQ